MPRSSTSRPRTPSTRSSSTARSPEPGGTTAIESGSKRSDASRERRGGRSTRRPNGLPRSTARALSQRELNRATLARQLLLERARLPVARAVERLCAMQAQSAKAPYVGLWSRLEGFRREQLTRAYERKRVVRSTLFRVTMQLVSAADHPSLRGAHARALARRVRELEAARGGVVAPDRPARRGRAVHLCRGERSRAGAPGALPLACPLPDAAHPRPAGRNVGQPPHPCDDRGAVARSERGGAQSRSSASDRALPRRLRPGVEGGPAALLGPPRRRRERRLRGARAAARPVRGRGRPDALRPATGQATAGGHARADPVPAGVGPPDPRLRRTVARASSRRCAGGDQEERRRPPHVPRGWSRRRGSGATRTAG